MFEHHGPRHYYWSFYTLPVMMRPLTRQELLVFFTFSDADHCSLCLTAHGQLISCLLEFTYRIDVPPLPSLPHPCQKWTPHKYYSVFAWPLLRHDLVMQPFEISHKGPLGVRPPNNKAFKVYSWVGRFGGPSLKLLLNQVMIFMSCLARVEK